MKKYGLTIMLILTTCWSIAQTKNFIDQPYLETTAKVDTLVAPDRIYLSILITEQDTRGKISVEELETAMAEKLKALGVNLSKQLLLTDVASNFKKYFLKQKDILKSKSYQLKVFDAQTAGRVLIELEKIGVSNIELEKTEYSKIEELKLELKTKAVAKAKTQALALIKPLGQKLDGALFISDRYHQTHNFRSKRRFVAEYDNIAFDDEERPLEIEFEKIKVESEVSVTFKIE